jgi:hypothetical protein
MITIFDFGVPPTSTTQSNPAYPHPDSSTSNGPAAQYPYDIDFDICTASLSPTSDMFEEGASSTAAGSPSKTPPGEKDPENETVIIGDISSLLYVCM